MKRKKKSCIIVLCLIGVGCLLSFFHTNSLLQNDYYEAINGDVLSKINLEGDTYTWSTFTEAQDEADEEMHQIVSSILENTDGEYGNLKNPISVVYENAMNVDKRNQDGLGILQDYLDDLEKVSDIQELVSLIGKIERDWGISILSNIMVEKDYEDTENYMVYLYPVVFPFGVSGDYFIEEDYMTYYAYIKRAMIQLLEVYGYSRDDAREVVSTLILFYQDVASSSKSLEELSDVDSLFYKVDLDKIQDIYSNMDISSYLNIQGIDLEEEYSLVDLGQYQKLNSYLDIGYLNLWKDHVLLMVLSHYASYLSMDYEGVVLELNASLMVMKEAEKSRMDLSEDLVLNLFSKELDVVYESGVLDNEKREYLHDLFSEVKNTYREMLLSNEWLSDETIEVAVRKLEEMRIYVGLEEMDTDISYLDSVSFLLFEQGGSLLGNVKEMVRIRKELELKKLKVGGNERSVGESVVNAYYSPMDNAIYVPTAIFNLIDLTDGYYENLGKIGMILAHEITHGFDGNGSKFDKNGNYVNWWLEEDRIAFELLKKQVSEYYSRYEVLPGKFLNGELTVNENIADLGAVRCIGLIAVKNSATFQEIKEMYSSYAELWASKSNKSYERLLWLQDTHAPNKYRVNAVLSSMELYYEVYDVSLWNDMYIDPDKRIQVW